ncbi:F-box/LRR-repeat protein 5 [Liparis tanakae]|uniref:F-box/LRR-repeat protein 5 n=1 Tax=Liparis tanakae TaxID=230148 RepID=A0A4Z2E6X1_9TELE|nr:F-box/LRR-repeat protein 5 [Liparis tanakae]
MAPFPDEVDVFTGPHWRMKQLVGLYCEKVCTDGRSRVNVELKTNNKQRSLSLVTPVCALRS